MLSPCPAQPANAKNSGFGQICSYVGMWFALKMAKEKHMAVPTCASLRCPTYSKSLSRAPNLIRYPLEAPVVRETRIWRRSTFSMKGLPATLKAELSMMQLQPGRQGEK